MGWREGVGASVLYAALAVVGTWPLSRAPATLGIPNPDNYANAWAMAWVVHQAALDPLHLFDSNNYFPHEKSLAFGESLLAPSLLAAPVLWLGGSPLLAHNLVLLLSFPLSALGAHALARALGANRAGALLAGLLYGFSAYRYAQLVHIQSLSYQWLPFALLFLRRAIEAPVWRNLLGLGACSALQALCSGYYAVLMGAALVVALLVFWRAALRSRALAPVLLSLGLSATLVTLLLWPHREVQLRYGLVRSREAAVHWSARLASFLEPGTRDFAPWLEWLHRRVGDREPLYPGTLALLLAPLGAAAFVRSRPERLAVALTLAGVLLSLGPDVSLGAVSVRGPYDALRSLPGFSGLRTPARLAVLGLVGVSVLAALGWTRLVERRRLGAWASLAVLAVALVEALPPGLPGPFRPLAAAPPTADWLARAPRGPVLELPWETYEDGALPLYWSTRHWQPMVNGFGAFEAPGNRGYGLLGGRFPASFAARKLREFGIRYIVVHLDRVKPRQRRALASGSLPEGVRLAVAIGDHAIYELLPTTP